MQVIVRDNNVDQALRALKKKLQREGVYREMKMRRFYEKLLLLYYMVLFSGCEHWEKRGVLRFSLYTRNNLRKSVATFHYL